MNTKIVETMTRPGLRARLVSSLATFLFLAASPLSAQEILTALEYFNTVADNYSTVEDYIANVVWRDESGTMRGILTYKRPNKVRIDFADPSDQLLVSNGETLMIYVPAFNVVLQQDLRSAADVGAGGLASSDGLSLMRRNYDIAYLEGPEPVPYEEGASLFVTQLRLDRRQVSEGYRELVLSIDEDGFIRRIEGVKVDWEEVEMEFSNIRINQRVSDQVFEEDPDPSASVYENFLYDPEG